MHRKHSKFLFPWMLIALWIFLSHSAMAINYQRIESGKWSEADKWSPKGVPGAADNATISGSLVVEIDLFDGVSVHDLTFNGFRITGKKTLKIEGDLTMTDGSLETIVPVIVKGNLLLSGGTINTNMSVLGAFKWSGGVFGNKGSTVTVTGLARLTGKEKYITKNTLILNGGGEWTSGNLEINSAGVLQIPSGQTFTVSTETKLNFVSSTLGGGKVENSGTFIKNGAGNLECELTRFNNSQTGVLQINNGGKMVCRGGAGLGGALQLSQENQLELTESTAAYSLGCNVTGPGTLKISSGTVTVKSACTLPGLNFIDGTLMCIGNLTIAGTLNWSGGTIGGPNTSGTLTVLGALNIVGPSSKTLSNQSVVAQAGGTHTGGSLNYVNGCSFTNAAGATFTIDNAQNLSGTYFGTYNNLGTLIKKGTGLYRLPQFNNSGTVSGLAGILLITGGINSPSNVSGTFDTAVNDLFQFSDSGTKISMSGASFTGPGAIKLDGPEIQFTGNMAFPALNMSNGSLKGQGNIDIAGNLNLSGGGIENAGFVQIGGALNWTGGGFGNGSTAAQVTVFGTTNISGNGAVLRNRNLLMSKGGSWTGGNISLAGSAVLRNEATRIFTINTDQNLTITSDQTASFENFGICYKNGSGTVTFDCNITNGANAGSVFQGNAGKLLLKRTSSFNNNSFVPNGVIEIAGGTHSINNLAINGMLTIRDGTLNMMSNFTIAPNVTLTGGTLNGKNISIENLEMSGGAISNQGNLDILQTFNWSGGTIGNTSSTGVANIRCSINLMGGVKTITKKNVQLFGGGTWTSGDILLGAGGALSIPQSSTLTINNNTDVTLNRSADNANATLENFGTLQKQGSGTFNSQVIFNNRGLVSGQAGRIVLNGNGEHSGVFECDVPELIQFGSGIHRVSNRAAFPQNGALKITGTLNLVGSAQTFTLPTVNLQGTLTGDGSCTLNINGDLNMTGGLRFNGGVNISGNLNWNSDAMSSSGGDSQANQITVNVAGNTQFGGSGLKIIHRQTIRMNGGGSWIAGDIELDNGSTLINAQNAVFSVNSTQAKNITKLGNAFIGNFENQGTLQNQGTSILNFNSNFLSSGTLQVLIKGKGGAGNPNGNTKFQTGSVVTVNGILQVSFANGFQPAAGDEFVIMTCGAGSTVHFSSIQCPTGNPQVLVSGNDVILRF